MVLLGANTLQAQWNTNGDNAHNTNTGNVGIGTGTPVYKLDVTGEVNSSRGYRLGGNTVLSVFGLNTFIGNGAGYSNTTGSNNTFSGFRAGENNTEGFNNTFSGSTAGSINTTGSNNTFSGSQAGENNTEGSNNTFNGAAAGLSNATGHDNTFNGANTGYSNTTGSNNTFSGSQAGENNGEGSHNVFNGSAAGFFNEEGSHNVFSGFDAGFSNEEGSHNVFSGSAAGFSNKTGLNNIYIGSMAGWNNRRGSHNVFLGYQAGYHETESNRLYIANTHTATPLIYGEFDNELLQVHGELHIAGDNLLLDNGQSLTVTRNDDGFSHQLFGMDANNDVLLNRSAIVHGKVSRTVIGFNGRSFDVRNGSNQTLLRALPNGNVGIGLLAPSAKLEVAGQVKITGGSPGAGKVLTSDANGLASWESLPASSTVATNERLGQLEAENKAMNERIQALEAQLAALSNSLPTNSTAQSSPTPQGKVLAHQVTGAVLYQNTPNPFNESTVIRYTLPEGTEKASIMIYNMNGEQLKVYGGLQGNSQLEINGHALKAGMYLYSLIVNGKEIDTKRMILTR